MAKSEHLLVHRIFHGARDTFVDIVYTQGKDGRYRYKLDNSSGKAELFTPVTTSFATLQEAIDYAHGLLRRLNSDFAYVENRN